MKDIPASPRINIIRNRYISAPLISEQSGYKYMQKHPFSSTFGFCLQKQRLLYAKGWEKNGIAYTTRLRRAKATAYVLENMPVIIDEDELIVGKPDLSELSAEEEQELAQYEKCMETFAPHYFGRVDHCALDFEKLLRVGVRGLIEEIEKYRKSLSLQNMEDVRKNEFYEACLVELNAITTLQRRYADAAATLAESAEGNRKDELKKIAACMNRVPYYPAESFYEALQCIHFYSFNLWGLYLPGRPDQYLYPYYERDVREGALTREKAQELIDCFCLMYSTYVITASSIGFMVGGVDKKGNPVENELTWAFVRSAGHTRTAYPSIGLAMNEHTSAELLKYSVKQIAEGVSHPALFNDKAIISAMIKHGFAAEDARLYIHSACVEITPCNKSGIWVVSPYINLMQVLVDVIESGKKYQNIEEIIKEFSLHLREQVVKGIEEQNRWQLERSRNGAEPMRASCLIDDCLKRGRSRCEGGAVYNEISPAFLGMSNVVDSLLTLQSFVFEKKEYTIEELNSILKQNYKGHEAMRNLIINKGRHFGNGDSCSNALMKKIAKVVADSCRGIKTFWNSTVIPGAFSYNQHEIFGEETQATPDGRYAGYPLADGSGPVQGRDISGPTNSILSVTAWDHSPYLGGIAVNLKFTKNQFLSNDMENVLALIKVFLERGGFELQFTIVDTETLKKAQKIPELYRDLTVRIGGYSDYFVNLSKSLQNEIIQRTEQGF